MIKKLSLLTLIFIISAKLYTAEPAYSKRVSLKTKQSLYYISQAGAGFIAGKLFQMSISPLFRSLPLDTRQRNVIIISSGILTTFKGSEWLHLRAKRHEVIDKKEPAHWGRSMFITGFAASFLRKAQADVPVHHQNPRVNENYFNGRMFKVGE